MVVNPQHLGVKRVVNTQHLGWVGSEEVFSEETTPTIQIRVGLAFSE